MTVLFQPEGDQSGLLPLLPAIVFEARLNTNNRNFFLNYINEEAAALLGVDKTSPDTVAFSLDDCLRLIHPDDIGEFNTRLHDYGRTLRHCHWQFRVVLADGAVRWLDVQADPQTHSGGGVVWRGIATDMTCVKDMQVKSQHERDRLILASCASGAGIWEFDFTNGAFIFNSRMQEIYGVSPDALRAADEPGLFTATYNEWLQFVYREDVPLVAAVLDSARKAVTPLKTEFRIRKPNGEIRHLRALIRLIPDRSGLPVRGVGATIDITDQQVLQAELSQERELRRVALESAGAAVISTDNAGCVTFMNSLAEDMTEWPLEAAMGKPLSELIKIVDEATGERITGPQKDRSVLLTPSGRRVDISDSTASVRADTGEIIGAIWACHDVSQSRALKRKLAHTQAFDTLTGLANRSSFEGKLELAWQQARDEKRTHALCVINLDRFKVVNDSAGHAAGDAMLREVARLIQSDHRQQDFAARLGGDEFALLLYDCSLANAQKMARRLIGAVRAIRLQWNDKIYDIRASAGLTSITHESTGPVELLSEADVACDAAKEAGRNQVIIYGASGGIARRHHEEILIAAGIRSAIEENRFRLYAQDILTLHAGHQDVRHVEILLRMRNVSGKIIGPDSFIPAAERYDLMGNVDRWVIENALDRYGAQLAAGTNMTISINLSANSINDPQFWPFLDKALRASKMPPHRVHFEITETALINNLTAARSFMSAVRMAGYGLILDDFGAGLSSFGYLKQFPVDGLKIDGSFIRQLKNSPVDRAIVESINEIGHKLGARTIAEFVEDQETLEILRAIGVDHAQGYAIGKPMPLEKFIETERLRPYALPKREPITAK